MDAITAQTGREPYGRPRRAQVPSEIVIPDAPTDTTSLTTPDFADVSGHNTAINWHAYAASNRRLGVTKATEGGDWDDPSMPTNRAGMAQEGLYCGLYHFAGGSGSHHINDPIAEADHFISTIGTLAPSEFPILDFELTYGLTPPQQVDWIGKWCDEVASKTHKQPWIYTGSNMLRKMDASSLTKYPLWVANYNVGSDPATPPPSGSWPTLTAWQFTDNAATPGINEPADRSWLYGDLTTLVGPAPSPSPAPAPQPAPAPTPAPGPAPTPQPEPTPSPEPRPGPEPAPSPAPSSSQPSAPTP
jgi:lysozyme